MVHMKDYDIVLIHPPRNFEYLKSNIKSRSAYIIMPMGLFGLADLLDREGYSPRIINYTLEKILDQKFSIIRLLKNINVKVVGVDLHWVLHSAGAIDILKAVKKYFPETFTLLGGFSATYYSQEIMKDYNFIDGIIQGDAEIPLIELLKNLNNLEKVPNLIYRKNGKIHNNGIAYVAQELDSLNFAKLKFLDHWDEYINYMYKKMHTPWPVEMSRGCIFNCVNCGGCKVSCKRISNRKKLVLRSPSRVVDDIKELIELTNFKGVFYGHGVYPNTETYFMEINKLLRKEKLDIHADLEIWRLPLTKNFIRDFAITYNLDKSLLWFSVRSFSNPYRKKYTKFFGKYDDAFNFSNKDLKILMDNAKYYNIPLRLFWDAGNPYENGVDLLYNFVYALKILFNNISKKTRLSMWSEPINISPGCPVELYRDKFGVKMHVDTFKDYLELNRNSKMRLPPMDVNVNYKTNYITSRALNLINKIMTIVNIVSVMT